MFQGQRGPSLVCYWGHLYLVFVKGSLGGMELLDLAKLLVQPTPGILLYTSMPSCFYSGFWGLNSGFYIWKARALLVEPPPAPDCGSFVFSRIVWVSHATLAERVPLVGN